MSTSCDDNGENKQVKTIHESFDIVIANHVLFYCEDLEKVCSEIKRVLKPGGRFVGSTALPSMIQVAALQLLFIYAKAK